MKYQVAGTGQVTYTKKQGLPDSGNGVALAASDDRQSTRVHFQPTINVSEGCQIFWRDRIGDTLVLAGHGFGFALTRSIKQQPGPVWHG